MEKLVDSYLDFISENKTERKCTAASIRMAEECGYRNINEVESLRPGDKVYVNKMDKSLILFHIGSEGIEKGMNILGAHVDSPRLDAKQRPIYEDVLHKTGIVYLNTHYYGGIKKYQWVTIPLAIHGVVVKTDGTRVDVAIGDDPSDPVFCISDILPHIAQEQMRKPASDFIEGEKLDAVLACYPNVNDYKPGDGKAKVLEYFYDKYGISEDDFVSAELEIVPAGRARYLGFDKTLVLGYGQDDRVCAFTSVVAMLESETSGRTCCCILADKEEIGSAGATGMNSHLLDNAVAEVVARLKVEDDAKCTSYHNPELVVRRALANSYMLSSDVNTAFDPLNWNLYDKENSSFLGRGVVFNKYTGSRGKRGASDANPEFIAKVRAKLCEKDVHFQTAELAKVDVGGGGTIAHFAAEYGMQVLDCGVSVLSMHAPWEITSAYDIEQAYLCYKAFLEIE